MEVVIGLLLMLLRVSHGVETYCDGRQDGAQCYGALGGTVVLQLMDSASEISRYQLFKNKTSILSGIKNKIVSNLIADRSSFTPSNGTFRINNLSRTDGGEYTLTIFDSDGNSLKQRTLQLIIQGVETYCDGRRDGAQCYGALGGTVVLQLMDSASEISRYQLFKNTTAILSGIKNKIVHNLIADRSSFTPSDGTFRINDLSRTDGGEYTLTIFDSDGHRSEQRTLELIIQGVETYCDGRQDGAQCYGALGGTVVLQLMDSASEISRYQLFKNKTSILSGIKNKIVSNLIADRSSFTPSNGTFRIHDLSWTDGGEYTLTIFDSNGHRSEQRTLQLIIQGVETYCDGRQDGAQCYGALGETVVLQLMDSASEISRYQLFKNKTAIISGRKNKIVINLVADRSSFTPSNGTFRINNLSRTDGGEYTLTIFDSDGLMSEQRTLQLTFQAPVSSVLLVSECLSQGEMRVSCSSEGGDSPQYSWTLDGHTLTDTQLLSGNNETNNITLKQDVSGQLTCSVKNHVSTVSETKTISTCGFIFIDCTCNNGMHISQWVFEANNTLKPTTTSITATEEEEDK
ncbi:uncharacterized protein LOC104927053 isoform X1 [Larimichthys crocea]|uniref:uncharacterized protein LOC104927053 isoform X1 n=1 Tax=Larimichthys crocea TaxID=215358 RepID=UPI000F5F50AB|nr:uncharacterized protein LOC104927053 isoform X1 [Larimichthys crocea]